MLGRASAGAGALLFIIIDNNTCLYRKNTVTLHAVMVLNWIWIGFFIIAFVIAVIKLVFWGDFDVFPAMMDSTFSSSKTAFEISLGLTGVLSLVAVAGYYEDRRKGRRGKRTG